MTGDMFSSLVLACQVRRNQENPHKNRIRIDLGERKEIDSKKGKKNVESLEDIERETRMSIVLEEKEEES